MSQPPIAWAAHQLELVRAELAGLVEDRVGDEDLADVVELGGADDGVEVLAVQADAAGERGRQLGDGAVVAGHPRDALGERPAEAVGRAGRNDVVGRAGLRASTGPRPVGGTCGAREPGLFRMVR